MEIIFEDGSTHIVRQDAIYDLLIRVQAKMPVSLDMIDAATKQWVQYQEMLRAIDPSNVYPGGGPDGA
jgi:hypothetical protein